MNTSNDVMYDSYTVSRLRSMKVPRPEILKEMDRRMDIILMYAYTLYRIQKGYIEPTADCSPERVKEEITGLCKTYGLPIDTTQGILKALMIVCMSDFCSYVGYVMSDDYIRGLIDGDPMEFPGMMRVLWVAATAD
jgi:hypothetical protein